MGDVLFKAARAAETVEALIQATLFFPAGPGGQAQALAVAADRVGLRA
jgi:hypothetical protein